MYSLSYPACDAHAPYCIVCGLSVCTNFFFPHPIKGAILGKILLNIKMCFDFLYNFCLKNFSILTRIQRDVIKTVYRSSCILPGAVVIFQLNLKYMEIFSKKSSNTKFNENPLNDSRVSCGRTDRSDEADSRFSRFCVIGVQKFENC